MFLIAQIVCINVTEHNTVSINVNSLRSVKLLRNEKEQDFYDIRIERKRNNKITMIWAQFNSKTLIAMQTFYEFV